MLASTTPGCARSAPSTRATQLAEVIPRTGSATCATAMRTASSAGAGGLVALAAHGGDHRLLVRRPLDGGLTALEIDPADLGDTGDLGERLLDGPDAVVTRHALDV